jgi:hypothetical protein
MPAPKGHPRWGNPIKPKRYNAKTLWEGACKYFDWVDKNPWYINEQLKQKPSIPKDSKLTKRDIKSILDPIVKIPTQRPYSIEGLCIFLNICRNTFDEYSKDEKDKTKTDVCSRIKNIIDMQHFEGGVTGAFDSGIILRKLGLVEKHDLTTDGESINAILVDGRSKNI